MDGSVDKATLIERILEIEVEMFLRVPTGEEPSCRAHTEEMKLHRRGQLTVWSEATLESYLQDLRRAQSDGRNLMTLKYARMDDLIPPVSESGRIQQIAAQFVQWQRTVISDYPNTMRSGRDIDDFANYLSSELETYSDETLDLLWNDVAAAISRGENLSRRIYEELARQAGYASLEEMESRLA